MITLPNDFLCKPRRRFVKQRVLYVMTCVLGDSEQCCESVIQWHGNGGGSFVGSVCSENAE